MAHGTFRERGSGLCPHLFPCIYTFRSRVPFLPRACRRAWRVRTSASSVEPLLLSRRAGARSSSAEQMAGRLRGTRPWRTVLRPVLRKVLRQAQSNFAGGRASPRAAGRDAVCFLPGSASRWSYLPVTKRCRLPLVVATRTPKRCAQGRRAVPARLKITKRCLPAPRLRQAGASSTLRLAGTLALQVGHPFYATRELRHHQPSCSNEQTHVVQASAGKGQHENG